MYVYVSKVKILPRLARTFLKDISSSSKNMNDTFLFEIGARDTEEVTGNVTSLVEASAFNNN